MRRLTRRQWIIVAAVGVAVAVIATVIALAVGGGGSSPKPAASPTPSASSTSTSASPKPAVAPTCPLTGRPATKGEDIHRPPLAVKIDNVDLGRPQSGVTSADVVIEETVEGGLTRLFSLFQCDKATTLGPVRSARESDVGLLRLFHGNVVFAYSGARTRVENDLHRSSHAVLLSYDHNTSLFYRSSSRPAPHNVFTSTETLLKAGIAQNKHLRAPGPLFTYAAKPAGGHRAHSVSLRWSNFASAGWTWGHHVWTRTQNGTPDKMTTGAQVTASNVLIMQIQLKDIGLRDVLGNPSPEDVVTGHGRVWLFRDGRRILGTWKRASFDAPFTLRDRHGKVLALAPGRTWVELLPSAGTLSSH